MSLPLIPFRDGYLKSMAAWRMFNEGLISVELLRVKMDEILNSMQDVQDRLDEEERSYLAQFYVPQPRYLTDPVHPFPPKPIVLPSRDRKLGVSDDKLNDPCPSVCHICKESPKMKECLLTSCEHYYCKVCWKQWAAAQTSSEKQCAVCKMVSRHVTTFVKMSARQQRLTQNAMKNATAFTKAL